MKTITKLVYAASAVVILATTSSSVASTAKLSSRTLEQPRVAVLPFAATVGQNLNSNDRMRREFESTYFAYRLVQALRQTGGVAAAYFSPTITPAADYNIGGVIEKSDGKMTVVNITAKSADGRVLMSRRFSVNVPSSSFGKGKDPEGNQLWPQIAKAIAGIKQKPGEFAVARTIGYAQARQLVVNDNLAQTAQQAAEVERNQILAPTTAHLMQRAALATPLYLAWQTKASALVEQRSGEKVNTTVNTISSIIGFAGGVAAGAAGDTNLEQQAASNVSSSISNIEVSQRKIDEIDKTLSDLSRQLVVDKSSTITVKLFGKVYTFRGAMDKQLTDFHNVVRSELTKGA